MIKRLRQKRIYHDSWLSFYQDEVLHPDGTTGTYTYLKRNHGVVVAFLNSSKELLLQQEYRYPIHDFSWELPGGGIDAGEKPALAAIREFHEETGITIKNPQFITKFYPLISISDELTYLYLATANRPVTPTFENTESTESVTGHKFVTLDQALELISQGQIVDLTTIAAIHLVRHHLTPR